MKVLYLFYWHCFLIGLFANTLINTLHSFSCGRWRISMCFKEVVTWSFHASMSSMPFFIEKPILVRVMQIEIMKFIW